MTKPNDPVRPVDLPHHAYLGLTKREHMVLEICKSINATEYSQTIPATMIANMAVMQADQLISKLNENSDF